MIKSMLELLKKQEQERQDFESQCPHPKDCIEKRIDSEYIGRGTCYPNIEIWCTRCGKSVSYLRVDNAKKVIRILDTLEEVALPPKFRGDGYKVISDRTVVEVHHRGHLE